MVQKSLFNNNYEIFQCILNSSNKFIKYMEHLFLKPQVNNLTKRNGSIKKHLRNKKSYSGSYLPFYDVKEIYSNNDTKSSKSKGKQYKTNKSFSFTKNSQFTSNQYTIDNKEDNIKYEQKKDDDMDSLFSNGSLNSLNKEINLDFGLSEIQKQNIESNIKDRDEIISSEFTLPNVNGSDIPLAKIKEKFKFMKKKHMHGHNRSHSVGADPFNNSSLMIQEKCLNLINGSPIPNSASSLTLDSPFNNPNTTSNINTTSKMPSLTSIVDPQPISDSNSDIIGSKSKSLTNSNILNIIAMNNDKSKKRNSNLELRSFVKSPNVSNVSSGALSWDIEKIPGKNSDDKSFCENESFSISQSTIKGDHHRQNSDSIFDNEISFNEEEEEIIELDSTEENKEILEDDSINKIIENENCNNLENKISNNNKHEVVVVNANEFINGNEIGNGNNNNNNNNNK